MIKPDEAREIAESIADRRDWYEFDPSARCPRASTALLDLAQQVEDLQEKASLSDNFREEVERCYEVANRLDGRNPDLKGSFMGVPSERIARQVEDLQADAARYRWLREEISNGAVDGVSGALVEVFGRDTDVPEELDLIIDEAMK